MAGITATLEDYPSQDKMIVNLLSGGRHYHGVLSDVARVAILEALAELVDESGEE